MLVEFPSVVEAVRCGAELQRAMIDRETSVPEDRRIQFRIGAVSEDNATVFGKTLIAIEGKGVFAVSIVPREEPREDWRHT